MASISDLVYSACCRFALLSASLIALFCLNYASKCGFSGNHGKIDTSAIVFLYSSINFLKNRNLLEIKNCSV